MITRVNKEKEPVHLHQDVRLVPVVGSSSTAFINLVSYTCSLQICRFAFSVHLYIFSHGSFKTHFNSPTKIIIITTDPF